MSNNKIRVLLIQKLNREYRVSLLTKLSQVPWIELTMIHGNREPVTAMEAGINLFKGALPFRVIEAPIQGFKLGRKEILWFGDAMKLVKDENFDIVITDYHIRILSTLPLLQAQKQKGGKTILWGIGFSQRATPLLDKFRKVLVDRSDALLLYSDKEKDRYREMDVDPDKCFVTQNTVDTESIDKAIPMVREDDVAAIKERIQNRNDPVLIHVGRLSAPKRLDILICSLRKLKARWPNIKLILIGDGPEEQALKNLVTESSLTDSVYFTGAVTDHVKLAPWMLASDLVVAPAQIGLLGPMAHAYGKALLLSDQPEHLYPELQVFLPGETGLTYRFGDEDDLVAHINTMVSDKDMLAGFGREGSKRVKEMMGHDKMLEGFLDAISYVMR